MQHNTKTIDELDAIEQQYHVYLLMNEWEYVVNDYGASFYVAPFETSNLIFGQTAAMIAQRKNERGEDCARD